MSSGKSITINRKRPIGVLDSGVGGLTVLKQLQKLLPNEDFIYFGDTARVPYGTKSKKTIIRFAIEDTRFLLKKKVKLVIVACNSASSNALPALRKKFDLPFISVINPTIKKVFSLRRKRKVGVIGTDATINSQVYQRELKRHGKSVLAKSCPLFVPLIEEGLIKNRITRLTIDHYLNSFKKAGVDALILGCTHYPLLKGELKKYFKDRIVLIDSAEEVARATRDFLKKMNMENPGKANGKTEFYVSDLPLNFKRIAKKFLGKFDHRINLIDIESFILKENIKIKV